MNLNALTAIFNKYTKSFRYGDRIHPLRDWWVVISVALVLLVASAGWSYWLFELTSNGQVVNGPAAPVVQSNANSLDVVRMVFTTRTNEEGHYLHDYTFVDPSR